MADTRAVLIGMGVVLIVIGFFVSNLVCGVGFLFVILGLVVWQREEDDVSAYTSNMFSRTPGVGPGSPARRRRARRVRVALVAVVVILAAVGGYLLLGQLTTWSFTGVRISAPATGCWSGSVGSGASSNGMIVGSCGSTEIPLTCTNWMSVDLTKSTSGNWTLSASGYHGGTLIGTYSVSADLGVVRGIFNC